MLTSTCPWPIKRCLRDVDAAHIPRNVCCGLTTCASRRHHVRGTSYSRRTAHRRSGGGISGLCLASVIAKYDRLGKLDVSVYESAPSFGEVGAGVAIWARSFEIIRDLDLEADLAVFEMKGAANSTHLPKRRQVDETGDRGLAVPVSAFRPRSRRARVRATAVSCVLLRAAVRRMCLRGARALQRTVRPSTGHTSSTCSRTACKRHRTRACT